MKCGTLPKINWLFTIKFFLFIGILRSETGFATEFSRTQILMGNVPVTITIKSKKNPFKAMQEAFSRAQQLEDLFSDYKPQSEISRLNNLAGQGWITTHPLMIELIGQAIYTSTLTHGLFDITFKSKNKNLTFRDIVLDKKKNQLQIPKGCVLGVSGIAKGFIVKEMSKTLKKMGYSQFLINAGDIYAQGPWKIELKVPPLFSSQKCHFWVHNQAVSTSGLYERGPHIINPKTKRPSHGPLSVTILAQHAPLADALATAAFMMNFSELEKLSQKIPIGILILKKNKIIRLGSQVPQCQPE